jgi:hypothetical protein
MDFHRQARPLWGLLKLLIQPSLASKGLQILDAWVRGEKNFNRIARRGVSYRVGDRAEVSSGLE